MASSARAATMRSVAKLQIVVLFERHANQLLQLRILEDLPPGKIRIRCGLSLELGIPSERSRYTGGV